MALVTKYFSVTAAGTGDGTTWANRAALFNEGNWSSVITGFDLTTDFLIARIGPGDYTCSQSLTSALFSNYGNRMWMQGCLDGGELWVPPEWSSAQPATWATELPNIEHTANTACIGIPVVCYGLRIRRTNASYPTNTSPFHIVQSASWCCSEITAGSTNVVSFARTAGKYANCVGKVHGTQFFAVFAHAGNAVLFNCRAEGNPDATGGIRSAFHSTQNINCDAMQCTAFGCVNGFTTTNNNSRWIKYRNTVIVSGVCDKSSATNTGLATPDFVADSNFFVGNAGIEENTLFHTFIGNNRIRATTPLNLAAGNVDWSDINHLAAGSDAAEFVDATNRDYRIKATSEYWGKRIGAGDEPASSGGPSRPSNPFTQQVIG